MSILLNHVNPVNTTLVAADDMLRPFNLHSRSKHGSKQLQLRRAETLARICRSTDRTVVLNQQIAAIAFPSDLGHVAFFSSHLRQLLKFSF